MNLELGTVFWMSDQGGGHYYVIITPLTHPEVLVVNFTTNEGRKERLCVVPANSHPALVAESVVAYEHAAVYRTKDLESLEKAGEIVVKPPRLSNPLMLSIWDGAFATRRMTNRCVKLLTDTIDS